MKLHKYPLCKTCIACVQHAAMKPVHLVHPLTRKRNFWDVRGEAVCPFCRALWRRIRSIPELVGG